MEAILEQIKAYADTAHGEQLRKYSPDRYIVHPVRVMETCKQYTNSLPVLAAALLQSIWVKLRGKSASPQVRKSGSLEVWKSGSLEVRSQKLEERMRA